MHGHLIVKFLFSLPRNIRTGSGAQIAIQLVMGLKQPGREAHHPPLSIAEF